MLYTVVITILAIVVSAVIGALMATRRSAASLQAPTPQTPSNVPAAPTSSNVPPTPANTSFPMPAPNIVVINGLAQVPAYIHRQMQAQKQAAVLMISSLNEQGSLSILRMSNGFMQLYLTADWPEGSTTHQKAQDFFARHGIAPQDEIKNGFRVFSFPMTGSKADITNTVQETLAQIIGVDNNTGLKFTYEERDL